MSLHFIFTYILYSRRASVWVWLLLEMQSVRICAFQQRVSVQSMHGCEIVLEWWWVRALWNIRPHSRGLILALAHCTPLQYLSHGQINRVTEASTVSLLLPEPFPETAVGGEKERVWRYRRRSRRRIERKTRESMEFEQCFLQNCSSLGSHRNEWGFAAISKIFSKMCNPGSLGKWDITLLLERFATLSKFSFHNQFYPKQMNIFYYFGFCTYCSSPVSGAKRLMPFCIWK